MGDGDQDVEEAQERSTLGIDDEITNGDYWAWTRHTLLSQKIRQYAIILLLYYAVGVAIYASGTCKITNHKVRGETEEIEDVFGVDDAIYFITIMLTSVGYGNYVPDSEKSRLFTTFYTIVGVVVIGIPLLELAERLKVERVRSAHRAKSRAVKQAGVDLDSEGKRKRSRRWMRNIPEDKIKGFARFARHEITSSAAKIITMLLIYALIFYSVARTEGWNQDLRGSDLDGTLWTFTDALYFTVITTTTIGYGDLVPKTETGRWLVVFIVPIGIVYVGHQLNKIAKHAAGTSDYHLQRQIKVLRADFLSIRSIKRMVAEEGGELSEGKFFMKVLTKAEIVNKDILEELHALFLKLDEGGNGKLQQEELEQRTVRLSEHWKARGESIRTGSDADVAAVELPTVNPLSDD